VRGFAPFQAAADPFIAGESERFLAVFKPAGMHSAPLACGGLTPAAAPSDDDAGAAPGALPWSLLAWLLAQRPDQAAAFASPGLGNRAAGECGMLSRLDRETSGLILFAKSPEAFAEALDLQAARLVKKTYRLAASADPDQAGLAGSRPALCPDPRIEEFFSPPGRAAIGALEVESYFRPYGEGRASVACLAPGAVQSFRKERSSECYSTMLRRLDSPAPESASGRSGIIALEAEIFSGFRHQIRAHLAWTGHAILGDARYRGAEAPRLFLEARRVEVFVRKDNAPRGADLSSEIFELYGEPSNPDGTAPVLK